MADTLFGFPRYPKFDVNGQKYPTDSFLGRYLNYCNLIDPRTLFASKVSSSKPQTNCLQFLDDVNRANRLLEDYNAGRVTAADRDLWEAQKLRSAIYHPDTKEKILPPFRMSGNWNVATESFMGFDLVLAMGESNNRNASQAQPFSTYAKAYVAAVSAAMSISAVLTWFIRRSPNLSSTQKMIVQRFVPLPATSLASTLNVICMRAPELKIGITVFDNNGKEVGVSKKAARKAVYETALTRAFLPIPLLLLPPCIMPFFEKLKFVQKSATRHLIVNAIVCTISFGLSLPVALALFPQKSTIRRADIEKELQDRTTICAQLTVHSIGSVALIYVCGCRDFPVFTKRLRVSFHFSDAWNWFIRSPKSVVAHFDLESIVVMRLLTTTCFLIIPLVLSAEEVNLSNNESGEFCTKYAACRQTAKTQLKECTGGLVQMFLNKHTAADNQTEYSSGYNVCKEELAVLLDKSILKEYDRIEQAAFKCVHDSKSTLKLDEAQELICKSAYTELHIAEQLDSINANTTEECQSSYEQHIEQCELVRTCCPEFDRCQNKIEMESGVRLREKMIVAKFEKCVRTDGNVTIFDMEEDPKKKTEDSTSDVRFAPRRHRKKKSKGKTVKTATPVPRVQTNVINGHGRSLIRSYRLQRNQEAIHAQNHKVQRKIARRAKAKQERDEKAKLALQEEERIAAERSTTDATTPTTSPATPPPVEQETKTEEQQIHNASKKMLDEQRKHNRQSASHDSPSDIPTESSSQKAPSPQETLNRLLCSQHIECEKILKHHDENCDQRYGARSEHNHIEDSVIKSVFVNNSKTSDSEIRQQCLQHVDKESQKHLLYLRSQKEIQDRECTMKGNMTSNDVEVDECQEVGILSEYAKIQPLKDEEVDLNTCLENVSSFRQKCQALRSCCPQKVACERTNRSPQARKFSDIMAQLKMEQILCEKRLTRFNNQVDTSWSNKMFI
ncbi:Tricarboxylate iron carrier domain containing protein [Aphelenchoides besseyi]|nr:Tricarboxylate iron carrier domain containing protein [Aphelenchoides besseyi]